MKTTSLALLILAGIFSGCKEEIPGQLFPRIDPQTGNYLFFYHDSLQKASSVSLAGSFNNWDSKANPMKKIAPDIWSASVKLTPGRRESYKFVVDGNQWISDVNAPYITMDQWRNSVIETISPDQFGLLYSIPVADAAIIKPQTIRLVFHDPKNSLTASSIRVSLNGLPVAGVTKEPGGVVLVPVSPSIHGQVSVSIEIGGDNLQWAREFQCFIYNKPIDIKTPDYNDAAILYEIYIRQFQDSNGDRIGDFNGIRQRLGYLDSLGVTALWMMPWNESPRDHGYAITDYYAVDQEYGTLDDFRELAMAADELGMDIWMDFVINHVDTTHPFFLDVKRKGTSSKYWNWFQMTGEKPLTWKYFGQDKGMPKLNFYNLEVQDYFLDVAEFWLDPNRDGDFSDGVDGFRCDAAIEVNHAYWDRFRRFVKEIRPDVTILGEIWVADQLALLPFYNNEFDMTFDYPLFYTLKEAIQTKSPDFLKTYWQQSRYQFLPNQAQWVTFWSNHDNWRSFSRFDEDFAQWKQAQAILFTLPGTPMIYYGDDYGLVGKNPPDYNVRQPMMFPSPDNRFYSWYQALIDLRKSYPELSLKDNSTNPSLIISEPQKGVLQLTRQSDGQVVTGYFNLNDKPVSLKLSPGHNVLTRMENTWKQNPAGAELNLDGGDFTWTVSKRN